MVSPNDEYSFCTGLKPGIALIRGGDFRSGERARLDEAAALREWLIEQQIISL